jgi:hypothetical protein
MRLAGKKAAMTNEPFHAVRISHVDRTTALTFLAGWALHWAAVLVSWGVLMTVALVFGIGSKKRPSGLTTTGQVSYGVIPAMEPGLLI